MLSPKEIRSIVGRCVEISDELADIDRFISARKLSEWFDAELVLRPLLVEGMLASIDSDEFQAEGRGDSRKWAVLLDSETYSGVTENDINFESIRSPLPCRLRNTIAHELVHSFAFRSKEFGVELTTRKGSKVSRREFVEQIEKETERFSPFLLIPSKYLATYFSREKKNIDIQDLKIVQQQMGVSRYVLINRFKLLKLTDENNLLERACFRNFAVGIGEWMSDKEARLKDWPLFYNFHRNVPEFLHSLGGGKLASVSSVFNDPSFALCGGDSHQIELTMRGGTSRIPNAEEISVVCSVEPVSRRKGSEFLFVVRSVQDGVYV